MTMTPPPRQPTPDDTCAAAAEQAYRSGAYRLLAALLRSAPDDTTLRHTAGLNRHAAGEHRDSDLPVALTALARAACNTTADNLANEYHRLFIGLGRGELVPYGAWYQTGFLMERPLGVLRDDLAALGFERATDVKEPEDHVAALFEVMALLITDGANDRTQWTFFERHLAPWIDRFFTDLAHAQGAVFYQTVAHVGQAFMTIERRYLTMPG